MMKLKNTRKTALKIDKNIRCRFYQIKGKGVETIAEKGSGKTVAKIADSGKTIEIKDVQANGKAIENENVDIDNKANMSKAESESRRKECALKFLEKFEERERLRLLQQQDQSQCQGQGQIEGHGDQCQNLGPNQDQGEGECEAEGQNTGEKRKAEDEAQNEKKKLKSDSGSDAIDGNEESDQKRDDDGDKEKDDDQTPSGSGVSKADIREKEQDREIITLEVNEPNSPSIISRIFPWTKPSTYKYSQKVGDWTLSIQNLSGHGMIAMKIFETPGGQLKIRIFGRYQNQKTSYANRQHHVQVEVLDGTTLNQITLKVPRAFHVENEAVVISQDGDFTELLATPFTCVKRM